MQVKVGSEEQKNSGAIPASSIPIPPMPPGIPGSMPPMESIPIPPLNQNLNQSMVGGGPHSLPVNPPHAPVLLPPPPRPPPGHQRPSFRPDAIEEPTRSDKQIQSQPVITGKSTVVPLPKAHLDKNCKYNGIFAFE